MIRKKDVIHVKRKYTSTTVRQRGQAVEVERCVTRYVCGSGSDAIVYEFPLDQGVFEIQPRHLPLILSRCDMEVVADGKLREEERRSIELEPEEAQPEATEEAQPEDDVNDVEDFEFLQT